MIESDRRLWTELFSRFINFDVTTLRDNFKRAIVDLRNQDCWTADNEIQLTQFVKFLSELKSQLL